MEVRLDPWASAVRVEYEKLFKYFGITPFTAELKKKAERVFGELHPLIRRGVVFGHRDYDKIVEAYARGEPVALLTGFMPSGRFHLGHKMVADQIIYYQRVGFETFVVLADAEAYAVRRLSRRDVINYGLYEYVANLIALGLRRERLHLYFQTNYEKHYYRLLQLFSRRITMAELEAIYGSMEPCKVMAALTQAADILHPELDHFGGYKHVLVPVGADQDPHIRLSRDIADRYENELGLMRPASTYHRFIIGLDGNKMSSSRPDYAIFLTDDPEEARRKVYKALTGGQPTVKEQRMLGGHPERCSVYELFVYHLIEDDNKLRKIYEDCRSGALLCGECKRMAADLLEKMLLEHQRRLERAKDLVHEYVEPPDF